MTSPDPDLETSKVSTFALSRAPARNGTGVAMESRTMSIRSIRESVSSPAAHIPVEFRTLSIHVDTIESRGTGSSPSAPKVKDQKHPKGAVKGLVEN